MALRAGVESGQVSSEFYTLGPFPNFGEQVAAQHISADNTYLARHPEAKPIDATVVPLTFATNSSAYIALTFACWVCLSGGLPT